MTPQSPQEGPSLPPTLMSGGQGSSVPSPAQPLGDSSRGRVPQDSGLLRETALWAASTSMRPPSPGGGVPRRGDSRGSWTWGPHRTGNGSLKSGDAV